MRNKSKTARIRIRVITITKTMTITKTIARTLTTLSGHIDVVLQIIAPDHLELIIRAQQNSLIIFYKNKKQFFHPKEGTILLVILVH